MAVPFLEEVWDSTDGGRTEGRDEGSGTPMLWDLVSEEESWLLLLVSPGRNREPGERENDKNRLNLCKSNKK